MGWASLLMSLIGGGDDQIGAQRQTGQMMGGLSSLMSSLGGPSMMGIGNMPNSQGGQQLNEQQKKAIFDSIGGLFKKKSGWEGMGTVQGPNEGTGE